MSEMFPSRCGLDWGEKGGPAARECALWVQLQRELRNRGIMEEETEKRLNATHMVWTPQVCITHQPMKSAILMHRTRLSRCLFF